MMISTSAVPPGGWHFLDQAVASKGPIMLRAVTFDKLVQVVIDHRVSNGARVGNVVSEVMEYLGSKFPQLNQQKPTFIQQTISFATALKNYVQGGGKLVDDATAARRADICIGCHNNKGGVLDDGSGKKCGTCAKAAQAGVATLRKAVLNGRTTPRDSVLFACQLCGCDLKLKVWFPVRYFDPDGSQSNKWPEFCWMKEL